MSRPLERLTIRYMSRDSTIDGETARTVAARVSPGELRALEEVARANDRSASREVRRAIRFYLAHLEEADRFLRAGALGEGDGS